MIFSLLLLASAVKPDVAKVDETLLRGLPAAEAVLTAHGTTQKCSGPSLSSVLDRLGYPKGVQLRGPALESGVVIRGRDGYAVLFSLGELDEALGGRVVVLATQCDGKPLSDEDGPYRLVVPGEQRAARSVRQVMSIEAAPVITKAQQHRETNRAK